jgi:KipI family sensor histidine kinase inhibitor
MKIVPQISIISSNSLCINVIQSTSDVLSIQKYIWALTKRCKKHDDFTDLVPAMNSLTLYLKSSAMCDKWLRILPDICNDITIDDFTSKHHILNTQYNGEDIKSVADYHNINVADVIEQHSSAKYHVLFLGFQPGFAYLHGLPTSLHTPRRSEPRLKVPKGSVAIGASQTGIYPADTPGGWHIIGHCDSPLFDVTNLHQPCLFQPGDTIQFRQISLKSSENHD